MFYKTHNKKKKEVGALLFNLGYQACEVARVLTQILEGSGMTFWEM
jgi:hypothetical protein